MTNCKYVITLPNGEKIEILAKFGKVNNETLKNTISSDEDVIELSSSEDINKLSTQLINELKQQTPTTIISESEIKKVVDSYLFNNEDVNVSEAIDNIVVDINNIIETNAQNHASLELVLQALVSDAVKNEGASREEVNSIISKLESNTEVTRNYLKNNVKLDGAFNVTTLNETINSLSSKETLDFGLDTNYVSNFNKFLDKLPDDLKKAYIFKTSSPFGNLGLNVSNNVILYNNYNSLFLSLLKALGNQNKELLTEVTGGDNKFFTNTITKGRISESKFDKLLKNKVNKSDVIKIIEILDEQLGGGLKDVINDLIFHHTGISIDVYNDRLDTLDEINQIEQEATKHYRNFKYAEKFLIRYNDSDTYYTSTQQITSGLYDNAKKLKIGEDIVKLPYSGSMLDAVVTDVFPRNKGEGVYIRGIYITENGSTLELSKTFYPGDTISYRSYEIPKWVTSRNVTVADSVELDIKDVDLYNVIRIGDKVGTDGQFTNFVVNGIYPNYITYSTDDQNNKITYSEIKTFSSQLVHENFLESDHNFKETNSWNDVIVGDVVEISINDNDVRFVVLNIDDNKVTLSNGNKTSKFNKFGDNKADIKRYASSEIVANVTTEAIMSRILNKTVSTFKDKSKAKSGDYVKDDNSVYRIVGDRLIKPNDRTIYTFGDLEGDVIFMTDRDISSKTFLENLRVNRMTVEYSKSSEVPKNAIKLKYIINGNTESVDNLILLPDNYGYFGRYVTEHTPLGENDIDVTDHVKKLLGIPSSNVLYVSKKGSEYNYNTSGYIRLLNLNAEGNEGVSFENIKSSKLLSVGNYIKLVNPNKHLNMSLEKNIASNKYLKIINVDSENITVQENNIMSDGKIITNETVIPIETLEDNIQSALVRENNSSLSAIVQEEKGSNKINSVLRANKEIQITQSIEGYLNQLGIEVGYDNTVFNNKQKAKLETNNEGEVRIILSEKRDTDSLIHEFLHVFLTGLRHSNLDLYGNLIKIVDADSNVYDAEESFVNAVINTMNGFNYLDFESLFLLNTGIIEVLSLMENVNKDKLNGITEFINSLENVDVINNPLHILNKPISEIFNIQAKGSPLLNMSLIVAEPAYRNWMKNNNIKLNCS